jgi:hypothetical protein
MIKIKIIFCEYTKTHPERDVFRERIINEYNISTTAHPQISENVNIIFVHGGDIVEENDIYNFINSNQRNWKIYYGDDPTTYNIDIIEKKIKYINFKSLEQNFKKFHERIAFMEELPSNDDSEILKWWEILAGFNPNLEAKLIINKLLHKCLLKAKNEKQLVFDEIDRRLETIHVIPEQWKTWKKENELITITSLSIEDLWTKLPTE